MNKEQQNRLRVLRAIGAGADPVSVSVKGEPFTDDHILCCVIRVTMHEDAFQPGTDPGTVTLALNWCGWEMIAAAEYHDDSPKARKLLLGFLREQIKEFAALPDTDPESKSNDEELVDMFKEF